MKITFSNIQPNSKESKIWLDEKGQLRTYNQRQQKWIHGTVSSEPDDKPEDTPEVPEQPKEIKFYLQRCHLKGGELEEYTAVEGMTWAEFCASDEYNLDIWYAYDLEIDGEDTVETFVEDGFGGASEWGWITSEDSMGDEYKERSTNKIIADYTYYEQFDSDAGLGGGGWG